VVSFSQVSQMPPPNRKPSTPNAPTDRTAGSGLKYFPAIFKRKTTVKLLEME